MPDSPSDERLSIEHRAALMLTEDLKTLPKLIEGLSGRPAGVQPLSPDNELWAWNYVDEAAIPDAIQARLAGKSDVEIAAMVFPLRRRLIEQGGVTEAEQRKRSDTLAERAFRAQQAGRVPKPPPRPEGGV